jgi:hypothetical protein
VLQSGGQGATKTSEVRAGEGKGDVDVVDSGHGREKGEWARARVEIIGGRRGRSQLHDTRAERAGGGGGSSGGGDGALEAGGGVQWTNKAREDGVDVLDVAAEALNLNDGQGRHADGVGVAHPPERERTGGAHGCVKEVGARSKTGHGGGEGGIGDVPQEGEGEVGDGAEEALQGLRRGGVQPAHVRLRPRGRQFRRLLPRAKGLDEGGEDVGAREDPQRGGSEMTLRDRVAA